MGAFFICHEKSIIAASAVEKLYKLKGFKNPFQIRIGDYNLLLYRKQAVNIPNHFQSYGNYIFVIGSLFYRGLSYGESLKSLLSDFLTNSVETESLFGNYVMIFYEAKTRQITFCIDPAFIKSVYFDSEKKIITTDFLAILESNPGSYTLNNKAILENLITGNLISPDTYAEEIQIIDRKNITIIESVFQGIKVKCFWPNLECFKGDCNSAVKNANNKLSAYFAGVKSLTDDFGAHIGLTGGLDSRLLLMHARKHLKHLITNSFWQGNSLEYINAKLLAEKAKLDFISFEKFPFNKPDDDVMMTSSLYFFDGQSRSQNNWKEEFSLPEYSLRIASDHFVGFHGCGGEQYRNADRMILKIPLKTYIQYEWMFRRCQNSFIDKRLQESVYENIEYKIRRLVDIQNNNIGLCELKKIQNEIWNKANRTTRLNLLNQQQFYFAPFTEYSVSTTAYSYVQYLGGSFSFQIEMMRDLDIELAGVPINYGFDLRKGESLKYKLMPYLFNLVPRSVFYFLYHKLKKHRSENFVIEKFLETSHSYFHLLKDRIDLEKIGSNPELGPGLGSIDYLLKHSQFKINK